MGDRNPARCRFARWSTLREERRHPVVRATRASADHRSRSERATVRSSLVRRGHESEDVGPTIAGTPRVLRQDRVVDPKLPPKVRQDVDPRLLGIPKHRRASSPEKVSSPPRASREDGPPHPPLLLGEGKRNIQECVGPRARVALCLHQMGEDCQLQANRGRGSYFSPDIRKLRTQSTMSSGAQRPAAMAFTVTLSSPRPQRLPIGGPGTGRGMHESVLK